ncbi:MAG: DHH family phosphoesterase [Prevotella sp.]|nr:DHH family phosphoesterase [Prevotella sp.]
MQIDILTDSEAATIRELIAASQRIIICCHKSPDGDAIGSSLGWAEYLSTQGKAASVVIPDMFPDFLRWMANVEKIVRHDKHKEQVATMFQQADLIFCLDFNEPSRLEDMQQLLLESPAKKVMIDHHLNPKLQDALIISHPEMSSTSELVFRIIWQLGGFEAMTRKGAASIYCGMMTDTGGFTFNSSMPEIYFIIGQLLTKRINKDKIYRKVYNNYSSWAIRLRGYILYKKLNVIDHLHASYFTMTRHEMEQFHFMKGDAEGLVNIPLQIKGMKLSVSLREDNQQDGVVWVSLRSVDDFPCNKMAEEFFNGGGHLNASGGKLLCSIREAEEIVRKALTQYEDMLKR